MSTAPGPKRSTASTLSARLRQRAAAHPMRVVLPEGDDPRIVAAARRIIDAGIAELTVLGSHDGIAAASASAGVTIEDIPCLDPATDPRRPALAQSYLERRHGGEPLEPAQAVEVLADPVHFATMLVATGAADGLVAGALTTTADTIQPALAIRRLAPGLGPIASVFLMELPAGRLSADIGDVLVFADCALNTAPSPALLAQIAIVAGRAARELGELKPRVALLSSSTKGSAAHEKAGLVREAVEQVRRRAPELVVDGELQVDAALLASVAAQKAPGSPVAGRANVLVFPDLEAGNIGYKLVERLAGAEAIGPIFFGLNWPVNDLSRGCTIDEVVDVTAVTVVQAQTQAQT